MGVDGVAPTGIPSEERDALWEACQALPPDQRTASQAASTRTWGYAEIAALTGEVPTGSAMMAPVPWCPRHAGHGHASPRRGRPGVVAPGAEAERSLVGTRPDFDGWVAARGPSLLRLAYVLTGDARKAEDLVEEVLAKTLARWRRISKSPDCDATVRRMLLEIHASRWRRFRRRDTSPRTALAGQPPELGREVGITLRDAVWDACAALPPEQRTALVLRFYEDLPAREIANLTGDSESSVRSVLAGGIDSLRTALARP